MSSHETPDTQQLEAWIREHDPARDALAPELSLIIPAFNEYRRLPVTLMEMVDYLNQHHPSHEIIVVDDGSSDDTSLAVRRFERICPQVRLARLPRNYGKGLAVKFGMLNARGRLAMFADADGAAPIAEIERLFTAIHAGADVAFGSRAAPSVDTKITTRWYRKYLGRLFNTAVNMIILPDLADTQCGFKMFTAEAARFLFERQRSEGFSFDVELLYIARKAGMKIAEIPINWNNVPGSKVNLVIDSLKMFRDLFVFKIRHRAVSPSDFVRSR